MKRSQSGFTLIELLVVIAIIGLLSTLAVVALNSARQRSRDAKRVSDIRQIQTALELGYSELNAYPVVVTPGKTLGDTVAATKVLCNNNTATPPVPAFVATSAGCGTGGTGTIYMGLVPSNPGPGGANYTYISDGTKYSITFTLEGATGQLTSGANCANQNGIIAGGAC
jgi:general secretion pathway protein G